MAGRLAMAGRPCPPLQNSSLPISRSLDTGGKKRMWGVHWRQENFSYVPRLPGWFFQQLIYGGVLPPPHSPPLAELRFPPLISCEKTAPSHQSLQKSPPVASKVLVRITEKVCISRGVQQEMWDMVSLQKGGMEGNFLIYFDFRA
jgi:hypothetical protein